MEQEFVHLSSTILKTKQEKNVLKKSQLELQKFEFEKKLKYSYKLVNNSEETVLSILLFLLHCILFTSSFTPINVKHTCVPFYHLKDWIFVVLVVFFLLFIKEYIVILY